MARNIEIKARIGSVKECSRRAQQLCGNAGDVILQDDFYVLHSRDWANIIALTPEHELVLVEQYRFGSEEHSLELPGGILDENEDPMACAVRELAEETGFTADRVEQLGFVRPNPAILNNRMHYYYAPGVAKNGTQSLDPGERIKVHLIPLTEVGQLIKAGRITHSLTVAGLMMFANHYAQPMESLIGR